MRPQNPALGERRDPVHSGQQIADVLAAGSGYSLAVRLVDVAEPGDADVARPAVSDHPCPRLDVLGDKRLERLGGGVLHHRHATAAEPVGLLSLDGDHDQGFLPLLAAAAQARLLAA